MPVDSALSKADIQAAKRTVRRGKPWPFVLFEGCTPRIRELQLHDWDDDNHERGCLALSRRDVCWSKSASDSTPRN